MSQLKLVHRRYKIAHAISGTFTDEFASIEEAEAALCESVEKGAVIFRAFLSPHMVDHGKAKREIRRLFSIIDAETGQTVDKGDL
jgi:hypothetical protein